MGGCIAYPSGTYMCPFCYGPPGGVVRRAPTTQGTRRLLMQSLRDPATGGPNATFRLALEVILEYFGVDPTENEQEVGAETVFKHVMEGVSP